MKIEDSRELAGNSSKADTLLFVVDLVNDSHDILDFACKLADRHNANLQLLHVIDPDHAPSSPDAQMGNQFSLEMLAQRANAIKRSVASLLSFGRPEDVISRRAAEVDATLVVLPLNGSASDRLQERLVRRLRRRCGCPVLALPRDLCRDVDPGSFTIRGLLSVAQQAWEGGGQPMRGPMRVSHRAQSKTPLILLSSIPNPPAS